MSDFALGLVAGLVLSLIFVYIAIWDTTVKIQRILREIARKVGG